MGQQLVFPPFQLDLDSECLFRGEEQVALSQRPTAVLQYLAMQAPQVISKSELIEKIWEGYNAQAGPKQSVAEIRKALGDSRSAPRFIKTVGRDGYQFIAPVSYEESFPSFAPQDYGYGNARNGHPSPLPAPPHSSFVGRATELVELHSSFARAQQGERQLVFIGGEAGIGKTALVDAFLAQLPRTKNIWVSRGQCIEHYGEGEAYLPILDALGRWMHHIDQPRLLAFLKRYAPAWLVQLPALAADPALLSTLQHNTQGATQARMLREFVEALEALTMGATDCGAPTVVLVLEDLHWSDSSTFDLLSEFIRRQEKARVLIVGTYRPGAGFQAHHPFRSMLRHLHHQHLCREIMLAPLGQEATSLYLERRFPDNALPNSLALALHQHTGGTPFFLEALTNEMIERGIVTQRAGQWVLQNDPSVVLAEIPTTVRHLVDSQIQRLSEHERRILETASLIDLAFSAATVAAVLDMDIAVIEQICADLVERHYIQAAGHTTWPDKTESSQYSFRHSIYRTLWQEHLRVAQQQRFHLKIAKRHEEAYGKQASKIALELALHFEKGREYKNAVRYLHQAAGNALQRSASREAIALLTKAQKLLSALSDSPERVQQELEIQVSLGSALMIADGFGSSTASQAYARARELCQQAGETPRLFSVLRGLGRFYMLQADYPVAREIGEQQLKLASTLNAPERLLEGHQQLAHVFFHTGHSRKAQQHLEQAIKIYDPQKHSSHSSFYGQDARVTCQALAPLALWTLGHPNRALKRCQQALKLGRSFGYPPSLAFALSFAASFFYYRRDLAAVQQQAEELIALATEQDFPLWLSQGKFWQGWVLYERGHQEEGIQQMSAALAAWQATGAQLGIPYLRACLALALHKAGRQEEALTMLEVALEGINEKGEAFWAAEVYRLKGEMLLDFCAAPTKKRPPCAAPTLRQQMRSSRSAKRPRR